jgi:hypothetical protein
VAQIGLPAESDAQLDSIEIIGSAVRRLSPFVLEARAHAKSREPSAVSPTHEEAQALVSSPYLDGFKQKLGSAKPNKEGFIRLSGKRQFSLCVTPACKDRAILVLERLLASAIGRGYEVKSTDAGLALEVDGEMITLTLTESLKRMRHEPTAAELARVERWQKAYERKIRLRQWVSDWDKPEIPEFDEIPSGQLMIEIDRGSHYDGIRRRFSDGKRQQLENMAERIVTAAATCAAAAVSRREEAARRAKEREEAERRWQEQERRRVLEKKRWEFLESKMSRLETARRLEQFVEDYQSRFPSDMLPDSCGQFLTWVSTQVDLIQAEIDPLKLAAVLDEHALMNDDTKIASWVSLDR